MYERGLNDNRVSRTYHIATNLFIVYPTIVALEFENNEFSGTIPKEALGLLTSLSE